MLHSVQYFTDSDRRRFISEAQAQGETMLHDEIRDGVWTLDFDLLPTVAPLPPTELDLLYMKLRIKDVSLAEINNILRLERG